MRKTIGLAALTAAAAGVFLPAAPASADHCPLFWGVVARYNELDEKALGALPNPTWYCVD